MGLQVDRDSGVDVVHHGGSMGGYKSDIVLVPSIDLSVVRSATALLALLLLYQQFEDRILTPRVYGQTLNLPPVIVLVAVLIGGQLFGIPGVLLALPAAAVARVVLDYYLEQRRNLSFVSTLSSTDEIAAPDTERDEA